ncbi:hypothetical protein [Enterobacter cloacae complex sp. 301C7]|uniref:hypothetical protein n=1 Tax=Enterobacter cloacae complex sp. 301C7 TaxID=3395848 RepID=UPI003CF4DCE5
MRLNNRSQLAGFAKQDDLKFFAHTLCDIDYAHMPDLAPMWEMFERVPERRLGDIFFFGFHRSDYKKTYRIALKESVC